MNIMNIWEKKYIKYKNKYLGLQDLMGGGRINIVYNKKSYSFILNNDNIKKNILRTVIR